MLRLLDELGCPGMRIDEAFSNVNLLMYADDIALMNEGHKEGVLFTVHEENKGPFTVHEENKSPITVHEDNKQIYSTRVVNS